jgi:hypothetical protein
MSKLRVVLITSYVKDVKKLVTCAKPMQLDYLAVIDQGECVWESPFDNFDTRQALDFDFDITKSDTETIQSFRKGGKVVLVKANRVVLAEYKLGGHPREIYSENTGQIISVSFSPPNRLFLGTSTRSGTVGMVDLAETFNDGQRISIHYHIKTDGCRLMTSRGNTLVTVGLDYRFASMTISTLAHDTPTVKTIKKIDLKSFLDSAELNLENLGLATEGIVAFVTSGSPKTSLHLQYWRILSREATPTIVSSLNVTPRDFKPATKTGISYKNRAAFLLIRFSTIILLQNPTVLGQYALFQLSGSTIVWLTKWGRDSRLLPRILQGQRLIKSRFWYDAKTERVVLAVEREDRSLDKLKSIVLVRLRVL